MAAVGVMAIEVVNTGGVVKTFTPTGVQDEWLLELSTARGPEPGGVWSTDEMCAAIFDDAQEA